MMCNTVKIYISKRKDYNYCKKDMYQNENIKINVKEADIYMSQKFSDGFDVSNALSYSRREKCWNGIRRKKSLRQRRGRHFECHNTSPMSFSR